MANNSSFLFEIFRADPKVFAGDDGLSRARRQFNVTLHTAILNLLWTIFSFQFCFTETYATTVTEGTFSLYRYWTLQSEFLNNFGSLESGLVLPRFSIAFDCFSSSSSWMWCFTRYLGSFQRGGDVAWYFLFPKVVAFLIECEPFPSDIIKNFEAINIPKRERS